MGGEAEGLGAGLVYSVWDGLEWQLESKLGFGVCATERQCTVE